MNSPSLFEFFAQRACRRSSRFMLQILVLIGISVKLIAEEIQIINVLPVSQPAGTLWKSDRKILDKMRPGSIVRSLPISSLLGNWRFESTAAEKPSGKQMPVLIIGLKHHAVRLRWMEQISPRGARQQCIRMIIGGGGTAMGIAFPSEATEWFEEEVEITRWYERDPPEQVELSWVDSEGEIQKTNIPVERSTSGNKWTLITERSPGRWRIRSGALF